MEKNDRKRAIRRLRTRRITGRRKREHERFWNVDVRNPQLRRPRNWFAKAKALGCRKSRCLLCHYSKVLRLSNLYYAVDDIRFHEQMRELNRLE